MGQTYQQFKAEQAVMDKHNKLILEVIIGIGLACVALFGIALLLTGISFAGAYIFATSSVIGFLIIMWNRDAREEK